MKQTETNYLNVVLFCKFSEEFFEHTFPFMFYVSLCQGQEWNNYSKLFITIL